MKATLDLPRKVFRALAAYDRRKLWPWPHSYCIGPASFGLERSGDGEGQERIGEIITLYDHNGDELARHWIEPTGRETFENKAGKPHPHAKKAKRRIKQNAWGNLYGYEGTRKVRWFPRNDRKDAEAWRDGNDSIGSAI